MNAAGDETTVSPGIGSQSPYCLDRGVAVPSGRSALTTIADVLSDCLSVVRKNECRQHLTSKQIPQKKTRLSWIPPAESPFLCTNSVRSMPTHHIHTRTTREGHARAMCAPLPKKTIAPFRHATLGNFNASQN